MKKQLHIPPEIADFGSLEEMVGGKIPPDFNTDNITKLYKIIKSGITVIDDGYALYPWLTGVIENNQIDIVIFLLQTHVKVVEEIQDILG